MRRAVALLLLSCAVVVPACGDHEAEPVLPDPDFRPVLVIEVSDGGLLVEDGPRDREGVQSDPARVPTGSVVEIRNEGPGEHRVVGDDSALFDTGRLLEGETTTVVLTQVGTYEINDIERPDAAVTLEVIAAQESSTK